MKKVELIPSQLSGQVQIPPSKSISHRAIIASGLAKGSSTVENTIPSQDMIATCNAMEAFGAKVHMLEDSIQIEVKDPLQLNNPEIQCFESGSTLRFLLPLAAL